MQGVFSGSHFDFLKKRKENGLLDGFLEKNGNIRATTKVDFSKHT